MHSILLTSMVVGCIQGHMLMSYPPSRGYSGNPLYQPIDYNLNGPLAGYDSLCKGKPPGRPTISIIPGTFLAVRFEGSARHGGV